MNINQLRYFVSVADKKSFSLASKENYITQTAISQQIKQLEETLGVELINRSSRPICLTDAGKLFYKEVKGILERLDFAVMKAKETSSGGYGNLSIGYVKGYERSNLSNDMRFFHQEYPGISMSPIRGFSDQLQTSLLSGEMDIIFSWDSEELKNDERVEKRLLESVPMVAVLYASHPLARKKSLRREELKEEALIFLSPSSNRDNVQDSKFLRLYLQAGYTPDIRVYSYDAESTFMMVAAEEGIAIMPRYHTEKLDHADNLVFVEMEGEYESVGMYAYYLKENRSEALRLFRSLLSI